MKLEFEFISTHRNRLSWSNPCKFEIPWAGSTQSESGLDSKDPVSSQIPIITWSNFTNTEVTVVSRTDDSMVVSAPLNTLSQIPNYYQGAEFGNPAVRVNDSKFLGQSATLDYMQISVTNSAEVIGNVVDIDTTNVPGTVFVPGGSNTEGFYTGMYLYNETLNQYVLITSYDTEFHKVIADIPIGWSPTNTYDIRSELPSSILTVQSSTVNSITFNPTTARLAPGDFIRVPSTNEVVKIISYTPYTASVSPPLSSVLAPGDQIEVLTQTSDNYKTLSYAGTTVGHHEQIGYEIRVVSATIPNKLIKDGGGRPIDYPFLYIEMYDTNYPNQNNLFSNNHTNKSFFVVTTPTGLYQREEKFSKFTGDLNSKTIRFRPTSNFKIVWRLPNGKVIQFVEVDSQSPQAPIEALQTSVLFSLKRIC